ncbi:phosphate ABC transporter permease PstA [Halorubrum distributum]|uniref:Phosphate transport system permease protein PstA n=2 Tax=Halorubrum distributum TaxID=29283 RepID=M0NTZ6_9EURY|nr:MULTISPECIES: phosphate ABC transporter permease PstA [Halorubrum distributum group]EMA61038.1 phosphate ABC transporter permease [Halorubrum litoreum JCM 13561]MYL16953.1 phosphate ABC transporter permease PstA [Halorubrum terrestre]MYL66907.1 phosphate ABC transporter permease PstA [Halorubrum terrestre]
MSRATRTALVRDDRTLYEAVAGTAVGLSGVAFVVGLAALLGLVGIDAPVAGVGLSVALGALLLALGASVVGFGMASRFGFVDAAPQPSAGIVAAVAFTAIWGAVGAAASGAAGVGTGGRLALGAVLGGTAFAATAFPREDVGSTAPAGALAVLCGLSLLTGLIGPGWERALDGYNATLFGDTVVPAVVLFASLVTGWSAAKAYGGFGARGRNVGAYVLIYLVVGSILAVLVGLVAFVAAKGLPGLFNGFSLGGSGLVSWPFLTSGAGLTAEVAGVFPALLGTIWLVAGAVLFAVPTGVGAAVFLSEYAEQGRFTGAVEVATNGLWSTPSIVFGLFGAAFLIPRFGNQKSLIAGMLTLGFMLLPLVLITSREAILAVPDEYRDASAALGVSKWQTVRSVVLPAAIPGVTTGVILGVGRIAGETAPILLTMGGGVLPAKSAAPDVLGSFRLSASPPFVSNPSLLEATSALPYQLYALITAGLSGNIQNPQEYAWGLALTLLLVVLAFYAVGIATRYYFRRKLHQ